jgi:AcrR family transcriptional regulator
VTPAPRLSADDRRAQIVEAVTPAVLEHGAAITTRQLAEAAGVAEGTLFKAFGDKESLLLALAQHHLTTGALAGERESAAAAAELDTLEQVVTWTARVLVDRMRFVFRLVMALGPIGQRAAQEAHDDFEASKHRLAERFVPFRDELRVSPVVAAELVRTLAWAAASGWGDSQPVSSVDDIIQVLLHGITATDAATPAVASAPPAGTPASALETQKA